MTFAADQVRLSSQNSARTGPIIRFVWHHQASTNDDATIDMMVSGSREVSATWTIDNKPFQGLNRARITQVVDEARRPWTSGSQFVDGQALTVECANSSGDPTWGIADVSVESAAILAAYAFTEYGVPLRRITSAADPAGHVGHGQIPYIWPGESYPTFCQGHLDIDAILARAAVIVAGGGTPVPDQPPPWNEDLTDMIIAQDEKTGQLFLISGNTKLELPAGGGSNSNSPGRGNLYADLICAMTGQPSLVALNNDLQTRIPSIWDTIPQAAAAAPASPRSLPPSDAPVH